MQENATIKEKLLNYLEIKGISQYKLTKETGLTRGILSAKGGISQKNLSIVLDFAQDLNLRWLFLDQGPMIFSEISKEMEGAVAEGKAKYGKTRATSTEALKTENALLRKYNAKLEKQLEQCTALVDTLNSRL